MSGAGPAWWLSPVGAAVIGALVWWRLRVVEREVLALRHARHEQSQVLARLSAQMELVLDALNGIGGKR